ncbi:MAG: signal peptidase II [Flammeovirgaceae bacterium]
MKLKSLLRTSIILGLVFMNIGCDQVSKNIAREYIQPNQFLSYLNDRVILTITENTGAMLSLGDSLSPYLKIALLQVFPLIALLFMLRMAIVNKKLSSEMSVGLSFVVGGGIGNIYDRIRYGSVTDFMIIDFGVVHTAVFNMADVSVMFGGVLILFHTLFGKKEEAFV